MVEGAEGEDDEELSKEIAAMEGFFACPAVQFWHYQYYINEESPFSTQQGIKGAEFDRVLVILDDEEGRAHFQFSYQKYLGIKPLSDQDRMNVEEGKDTSVERTRRLFYVVVLVHCRIWLWCFSLMKLEKQKDKYVLLGYSLMMLSTRWKH